MDLEVLKNMIKIAHYDKHNENLCLNQWFLKIFESCSLFAVTYLQDFRIPQTLKVMS